MSESILQTQMISILSKVRDQVVNHLHFFLVLVSVVFAFLPLAKNGLTENHSLELNLLWTHQFSQQFLGGQIYPKWLEQSFASFGSPTFVFYPPICMLMTIPFRALGLNISQSLVGSAGLAILMMGIGSYIYGVYLFQQPHRRIIPAVIASLAVLSPYFLENIYVRGAFAESWGMVWIPWILWGISMNLNKVNSCRVTLVAVSYALLAFSHLPTLLIFTCLWAAIPLFATHRWSQYKIWCFRIYIPMILGMGLASIYLLPAALLQGFVNTHHLGFANPLDRVLVSGLFQFHPKLTSQYEAVLLPTYWLMIIQLLITLAAYLLFYIRFSRTLRRDSQILLITTLVSIIMMTDLAQPVYQLFPPLQKIQFSYRWMSVSGVSTPFLWGIILYAFQGVRQYRLNIRFRQIGILITRLSRTYGD